MGGIFLVVLDFFIVNVALPSMQRDLHAADSGLEWVVAGYGLTFSALLIAVTRLGDRWGRRRMFSLGTALFVVASAACGAAPVDRAPRRRTPRPGRGRRDGLADGARPDRRRVRRAADAEGDRRSTPR